MIEVPIWAVSLGAVLIIVLGGVIAYLKDLLKLVRRQRDDYRQELSHSESTLQDARFASMEESRRLRKQIEILTPPVEPEEVKKMREELEEMIHGLDDEEEESQASGGTAD